MASESKGGESEPRAPPVMVIGGGGQEEDEEGLEGGLTVPPGTNHGDYLRWDTGAGWVTECSKICLGSGAGADTQGQAAIAIGQGAGECQQGPTAVAIGPGSGNQAQGQGAVAVGYYAGSVVQGENSIAIGRQAGAMTQAANSIILNATGGPLTTDQPGLYIAPIRFMPRHVIVAAGGMPLHFLPATGEVVCEHDDTTGVEDAGSSPPESAGAAVGPGGPVEDGSVGAV